MPRFRQENRDANLAIVDAIEKVATRHDASTGQVTISWVLTQGSHVTTIPDTRRTTRLEQSAAAAILGKRRPPETLVIRPLTC